MAKNFRAKLDDGFIALPFDVRQEFGRARPPVKVSINAHSYRSTVSVYGGKYFVKVRKSNQVAAGIKTGDTVTASIALDAAPRTVDPPPELKAALAKNTIAKRAWDKLSFTMKKEHADAIVQAKKAETRSRRLQKNSGTTHHESKNRIRFKFVRLEDSRRQK